MNVTAKITTSGGEDHDQVPRPRWELQLPHRPLAVHHVAVAPDAPAGVPERPECEHPARLGRHEHERGVHAVAAVGAASAPQVRRRRPRAVAAARRVRAGARSRRPRRRASATPRRSRRAPARSSATIARPSPLPGRGRASSARLKRSKARAAKPGGKPAPSSRTCSSTPIVARERLERDRPAAVDEGVVDEVPERLLDTPRVGVDERVVATARW